MHIISLFLLVICLVVALAESKQFNGIPGLYCGLENCYDVLGATPESSKDEIAKLYRSLAKKWHPDRFRSEEEKATATDKFRLIASAYETLRDPGTKQDYDDMMENPQDYYHHYYRYYKRAYGAKVDARLALAVLVTLISAYQYWIQDSRYNDAVEFMMTIPRYRNQALDLATKRGLWPPDDDPTKRGPGRQAQQWNSDTGPIHQLTTTSSSPSVLTGVWLERGAVVARQLLWHEKLAHQGECESPPPIQEKMRCRGQKQRQKNKATRISTKSLLRSLEERTIREMIISENMCTVERYASKPDYKSILWIQLLLAPWRLLCYLIWRARWLVKFTILRHPFGYEDKIYLLRRNMNSLEEYCRQQEECSLAPTYLTSLLPNMENSADLDWMLRERLWIEDNFRVWRQAKEAQIKAALSQNACFKRYRRFMRKGGPGQITFLDD